MSNMTYVISFYSAKQHSILNIASLKETARETVHVYFRAYPEDEQV